MPLNLSRVPTNVHRWRHVEPVYDGPSWLIGSHIGDAVGPWNVEVDGVMVVELGEMVIDHPYVFPWFRSSPYNAGEPLP